jgi:hypothetical protein
LAVGTLQATLGEIHGLLGALIAAPELMALDAKHEKTARMAAALANVTRHYKLPALSPEKLALAMLFWTAGSTYGPVALAIARRKRGEQGAEAHSLAARTDVGNVQVGNVQVGPWFTPPEERAG